ncbi:MAG: F0F1 ATP synthase subunit alpha, partial [Verrucomicrobiia bacterium]
GHFDDIPTEKVKTFQLGLAEFLSTRKDALLQKIADKKALDADIETELKHAVTEYKGFAKI